ncbi:MAG: hypothetical protein ABFS42_07770 [Candidatus Krumholzibacteriota bacterium]
MTKSGKWKLGLMIGSGVAILAVLAFMGVATWYAGRINKEYKEVADSERILREATEGEEGFRPPAGGIPSAERIEVFLTVREDLAGWRRTMATASTQFAADQKRQRDGGLRDLLKLFNTGSDLMPTYAGFWTARNQALLAHEMGPLEYEYIYRLIFRTWLEPDRPGLADTDYPADGLEAALGPYREKLISTFDADVDPVELIFQEMEP